MSTRPKVLVTRSDLPASALNLLQNCDVEVWDKQTAMPREILLEKVTGKNALFIEHANKIDDQLLEAAGPQLQVIATNSVGYDHVDLAAIKKRKLLFGNTSGVLDDAVAELTIGILLTCTRRLFEGRDIVARGEWPKYQPLFWMNGVGLKDSVVGIVGLGRIGFEIAKRLVPFKVREILYTSRREKPEAREVNGRKVEMGELLKQSDIVVVMCVLNEDTRHLIGEKQLGMMKRSAILVNTSRGDVVHQEALVKALREGTIAGAALDVMTPEPLPPEHELLTLKNCCKYANLVVQSTEVSFLKLLIYLH